MRNQKGQFVKGSSGNPDGWAVATAEQRLMAKHNRAQVKDILNRLYYMDRTELEAILKNPATTVLESMLASICAKAIMEGDIRRVMFTFGYSGVGLIDIEQKKNVPQIEDGQVIVTIPSNGKEPAVESGAKEVVPDAIIESED